MCFKGFYRLTNWIFTWCLDKLPNLAIHKYQINRASSNNFKNVFGIDIETTKDVS